jgi:hypothetical protein
MGLDIVVSRQPGEWLPEDDAYSIIAAHLMTNQILGKILSRRYSTEMNIGIAEWSSLFIRVASHLEKGGLYGR